MKKLYTTLILILTVSLGVQAQDFPTTFWSNHADISWYGPTETEYTLTTASQLAGVSQLVAQGYDFEGITIILGANIDLDGNL
ncbi:hypothetical protein DFQ11_101580 [Winogradskyella epiphytica]|uniref:Uncharacterized protein n=1 Tax=Winogradskyella epiphytica TaxID=262005 RepID=A0A2V4XM41_9FLAO|nr:hypothetical protein [Winogradskyella epiphytica]PYE83149.1 hypothetical protein DFQ11_101580 [Winogradskyella epiphytica]GGW56164.1 hypothetical protein GCM10008085_04470 [Winogradskyella epiphytica]